MGDAGTPGGTGDDTVLENVSVTIFEAGNIQPLVIDPPGQNPLKTDAQGAYQFDNLIPGDYDLMFEKEGFQSLKLAAVTAVPSGFAPTVTLVETHGKITITVLSNSGTPETDDDVLLGGATVTVLDEFSAVKGTQATDQTGLVGFMLLPGTHTVRIEAADHNMAEIKDVQVSAGSVTAVGNVTVEKITSP